MRSDHSRRNNLFCWITALTAIGLCATVRAGDLRVFETAHYRFHTDLDESLATDLSLRMESMFGEYERRLADFRPDSDQPLLDVYLFQKQEDYRRLIGHQLTHTGGIFMAGRQNLLASYLDGQGRDALRRTLQHEAFHQFAYARISQQMPVWLNEGLAQWFEEGIWTGQDFMLGQVSPLRLRQLQSDVSNHRLTDFAAFLSMPAEQWQAHLNDDPDRAAVDYNQAWAMIDFLINNSSDHPYRDRLVQMLQLLHDGHSGPEAFRLAFSSNYQGFQDRFTEWAGSLQPSPESVWIYHQNVLADILCNLWQKGTTFPDVASFRLAMLQHSYRVQYTRGQMHWDTGSDPSVFFSDLSGQPLSDQDLYFEPREGAPLSDIVCRWNGTMRLRTRFYLDDNRLDHESLVESSR